ncbi:MAG: hypothetical protein L6R00_13500 [Phycisphaerae bacterium]|nr:hypothetical protein [Phycisphaerae bacterium]
MNQQLQFAPIPRNARDWRLVHSRLLVSAAALAIIPLIPAARAAHAAPPLYDLLPDNTLAAVYISKPTRSLPPKLIEPLLAGALSKPSLSRKIIDTIPRLPGPMLAAMIQDESRRNARDFQYAHLIIAELGTPPTDVDALVARHLLPLADELFPAGEGGASLTLDTTSDPRVIKRGDKIVFAYAVRDGRVFACDQPSAVRSFARGEYPSQAWVSQPGIRRWIAAMPPAPELRLLFNPAAVLKAEPRPAPNTFEWLTWQFLSVDDVRAVGGDVRWDRDSLSLDLSVSLAETGGGLARALLAAPSESRTLGLFPEDFTAVGRIGWPSAAAMMRGVYEALDCIAPEIGEEYRAELAEFRKETGVDYENDLTANLVGDAGFGVRVNFARPRPIAWAVVCPLADEARFAAQLDKLLAHFGVEIRRFEHEGMDVRASVLRVPFAFTIASGRLMIADSADTLSELNVVPRAQSAALPQDKLLQTCLERLSSRNTAALMINIPALRTALGPLAAMTGPMRPMLNDGAVGVALTSERGIARLRATWLLRGPGRPKPTGGKAPDAADADASAADPIELLSLATQALTGSVSAAREQAKQTVSMSRMRGVGQALFIYAQEKKAFPPDLAELVRRNMITIDMLASPYDDNAPRSLAEIGEKCGYIYRAGLTPKSDPREIVLAERSVRNGGAAFLFVDGHVEFIAEPRASELIGLIQAGVESVRP